MSRDIMAGLQSGHERNFAVLMPVNNPEKFGFHEGANPDMVVHFLIRPSDPMSGVLEPPGRLSGRGDARGR